MAVDFPACRGPTTR